MAQLNKSNQTPYSWEEIEVQVRDAILCQLSILQCLGPDDENLGMVYLGIDPDLLEPVDPDRSPTDRASILRSIPLDRHRLHYLAQIAFSYAYQLEGCERVDADDHYEISCAVLNGFPQTDMHGNPSPLSSLTDEPLRRVFETFTARWQLYCPDYTLGLSVRELALLSNMTIPAVRTSLSKEGFKLDLVMNRGAGARRDEDRSATLKPRDALAWLLRRRGFVPNQAINPTTPDKTIAEIFDMPSLRFDQALRDAFALTGIEPASAAALASTNTAWITALVRGEGVEIDVVALRALARALKVPEPSFVARAVHHLITLDQAG